MTAYANDEAYHHPILEGKGWWHGPQGLDGILHNQSPVLIIGNNEALSVAFTNACLERGIHLISVPGNIESVPEQMIDGLREKYKPWGIIHVTDKVGAAYDTGEEPGSNQLVNLP